MSRESSDQQTFSARYVQMQSEPSIPTLRSLSSHHSFRSGPENWIFEELPKATIVSVSRPDAGDISPILLSYTIEFRYKQFKWRLLKKASQVFYLHFALKKRAIIEEIHEKQEQVKEWLQNLGIGEHTTVVQDDDDADDDPVPLHHEESVSARNRDVPSSAALPIIRPALGRQHSISDRSKVAMQGYLNHFLGNMDIANSREVCKFLEVSKLSFLPEYGPKLKEDYIMVKHLPKIQKDDDRKCCNCHWFSCCNDNWQKVWVVLKPGFLALLEDPLDAKLLDIIVFDVLPYSDGNGEGRVSLAKEIKEKNPLRYGFKVSCGNRTIKLRARTSAKVKAWVAAINDAGLRPPEGWCHPHRFGSFAPPRGLTEDGSQAQWFVDGKAAFEAIALSIEEAKSEIFITDWWLCPELYLRRPFHLHGSSRLDALLEAKARQGVQIYILLYKEVALALKINSVYSKRRLLNIHENVRVLRYPDHFSSGVYLWSHHEKIVIVDHRVCFIGGLDLCFGRYDTFEHKVGDYPPLVWPGKDYYNPRESEPNSWEDTMKDELDREKYPRMPWHDVHCALWGPPCRDVARHFVQRWNYAKRNKAPNEQAIPLLIPQHHMVIPHYMGKDAESNKREDNHEEIKRQDSFSSRSSFQDIPLLLPQEPDGLDAANVNRKSNDLDTTRDLLDHPNKISQNSYFSFRKSKVGPSVPDMQMKGFVDDLDSTDLHQEMPLDVVAQPGMQHSEKEWWETQERGDQVVSADEAGQVGPRTSCHCQVIRSVGQWSAGTSRTEDSIHNAYCSLIDNAEHFIYIENQFFISGLSGDDTIRNRVLEALYGRIMRADKEKKCFRVIVVIPLLPGFQGGLDDAGAASVRAMIHWQYRTICRGPNSILHNLYDLLGPRTHDYISFYGLRAHGRLCESGPVATTQVYVHSKLMIIDDRMALIGSANINDRSLLGSRDSEIGVVIEDKAGDRYNLLHSAVLELFEYIRKENLKSLILYIVDSFWEELTKFEHLSSIQSLKVKYDQSLEKYEVRNTVSMVDPRKRADERDLDKEEQDYFNGDSDEEDTASARISNTQNQRRRSALPNSGSYFSPRGGLVDYDDDEDDDDYNPPSRSKQGMPTGDERLADSPALKRRCTDNNNEELELPKKQRLDKNMIGAAASCSTLSCGDSPGKKAEAATPDTLHTAEGNNGSAEQHSVNKLDDSRDSSNCSPNDADTRQCEDLRQSSGEDCPLVPISKSTSEMAVSGTTVNGSEPYSVR